MTEERIQRRLDMLEARVFELEQKMKTRDTTPLTPTWPSTTMPSICPKCGLKLEPIMGYVCYNNPCPTGLGGVWS